MFTHLISPKLQPGRTGYSLTRFYHLTPRMNPGRFLFPGEIVKMDEINSEYLTIKSGVVLPGLQAALSGVFWGGCFSGLVAVGNSLDLLTVPAWAVGVTVGSLASLKAWGSLLDDWRSLLYGIEPDSPAAAADNLPEITQPVRVELFSDNGNRGQFANIPASMDQLVELGRGIAAGDSFSVSRWTGAHGIFSRGEFESLRGELLKLGWLEWRSDRSNSQGVDVTRAGGAVFRHFASMTSSPPLIRR